jgi:murein DD-endopeptidase MepM/ murein hydrolase activator NlpD
MIEDEEETHSRGRQRIAPRIAAAALVLVFISGGAWAGLAPSGPAGSASPQSGVEAGALAAMLRPSALKAQKDPVAAAAASYGIVRSARLAGIDTGEALRSAFPSPREILALLALDRDVDDFRDYSGLAGQAGDYYRNQSKAALAMRPLRGAYERAFEAAQASLEGEESGEAARAGAAGAPSLKALGAFSSDYFWFAPRSDLKYSHPFALDVFFKEFEGKGEAHKGPRIRALYPGIVVASAGDWDGGPGASSYEGGGLSPAAGNGVVVYDMRTRRYYSYFHLRDVSVRTGDLVKAGEVLGTGGNTGMNARKSGHGGHVHVEVFDCARDDSLRAGEVLDLIKS